MKSAIGLCTILLIIYFCSCFNVVLLSAVQAAVPIYYNGTMYTFLKDSYDDNPDGARLISKCHCLVLVST